MNPASPDIVSHEAWAGCRVLVAVAHPDDEVLGCGALLATLHDVRIVHVTDGAPRDGIDAVRLGFANAASYAEARRREALAALSLVGLGRDRLVGLGIADQAGARHMGEIALALGPLMADRDLVLTHAFEGGHPDHDAVAFAVQAACRRLGAAAPTVVEMPFYHGDDHGWVRQRFVPRREAAGEIVRVLSPAERALKARMVAAHASQGDTLASFPGEIERFRVAPSYDFRRRPHEGPLLYERHGWNLTWDGWLACLDDADAALALP